MTDRISLCINCQTSFNNKTYIKPTVIGDIENGRIVPVKKNAQNVKTDNDLEYKEGLVSVWSWDDAAKGFLLNNDITKDYRLVERLEPNESTRGKIVGTTKIQEHLRSSLKKGLKVSTSQIDDSCSVFIVYEIQNGTETGILIPPGQYHFDNGIITSNCDENNPESLFAKLVSIRSNEFATNGAVLPSRIRSITLENLFEIINDKFPLVDLLSIGKKILKDYFSKSNDMLGLNFSKDQIESILKAADTDFEYYADVSETTVDFILSDSGVVDALHKCITGISPGDEAIEKFLSRNVEFQNICCEKVRDSVRRSMKSEIEKYENEIGSLRESKISLNQDCEQLKVRIEKLSEESKNKENLLGEIRDLQTKLDAIHEEFDNEKRMFINSLLSSIITENNQCSPTHGLIEPPKKTPTALSDYNDFIKSLKTNLKTTLDAPYSFSELTQYISVALRGSLKIIVSNDPCGTIANCISAIIDGRLCSNIDCSYGEINELIQAINSSDSKIIRIYGALNNLDYSRYFAICRRTSKYLIFDCDDNAVLSSAPPEIWYYSLFIDLSQSRIKTPIPEIFSEYNLVSESFEEVAEDNPFVEELVENKIISPMQASHLNNIYAKIGSDKSKLILDYIKQISKSNLTFEEYARMSPNE